MPRAFACLLLVLACTATFCAVTLRASADESAPQAEKPATPAAAPTNAPRADAKPAAADAEGIALFEQNVRPILEQRCFKCHSAKAEKLQGGLHLDSRPGWQQGGDSGPVIVPGKPEESLLVRALRYDDKESTQMPPEGKLPEREIALLTQWVERGAPDPREEAAGAAKKREINLAEERKHWAYQPLGFAQPPTVKNEAWCRTPIDRFVLGKLEEKGIAPNGPIERRKLIRRVYFDVIGLPPAPEAVETFVADTAPDAYEKLVDRVLADKHFGERWGRHWLDIARFAESHGFEQDYDRPNAYHYRDFVIRALNDDLPYDTFVRWQLAGDEFAPENQQAMAATGFLAAGVHATQITANQAEKERYDELDDMTRTLGTTMLGLTLGCARCHDHKYDPLPVKDYYAIASTFTTTVRSDYDFDTDPVGYREELAKHNAVGAPLKAALAAYERDELLGRFDAWRRAQPEPPPTWVILDPAESRSEGGATLKPVGDGSLLASGKNPEFDTYTIVVRTDLKNITGVRVEALADGSLVKKGPGRADNGNIHFTHLRVTARPVTGGGEPVELALRNPQATFEQGPPYTAATIIDDDPHSGWAVDPEFGKDQAVIFETGSDIGFEGGTALEFTLEFKGNMRHNIGRPRLSVTTAPRPAGLGIGSMRSDVASALVALGGNSIATLEPAKRKVLLEWYKPNDAPWQALNAKVTAHDSTAPKPALVKMLISSEGVPAVRLHTQGPDFYEKTFQVKRGDPNQKVAEASPGFLTVLDRHPDGNAHWQAAPPAGARTTFRRAALARWITDVDHGAGPLLARVVVNRLWQHHLGRGIVATASDFGTQGTRPTHPELLDWLAVELVDGGWRLKPIHKLILTSAVYLESDDTDEARRAADHDDLLCWRKRGQRLEAEVIRDAMLAVSGKLDETMFGPGTLDEKMRRRSVYFFVKRSQLIPMMTLFDAPDSLQDIALRPTTTVAPQALLMMNSPLVRGYAEGFAERVLASSGDSSPENVRRAYAIALGRAPSAEEEADGLAFLAEQTAAYRAEGKPGEGRLALVDFCQTLLSLNEFVFVD
ncbi:MAG TPA: PSD1 and planctomycete cytochrome C domain-containing protein [Pirellulales bacterium]|nr:PSD1 and planctomycete cytochrome C domain-containing protein [Pirellulales bacterium]